MSDLFGALPDEDPPALSVHTITVHHVAYNEPSSPLGIDVSELDYEIDHGRCDLRGEECMVEEIVGDLGLHSALFGVWDTEHRLEPTTYRVRGWVSHSPATPNGPEEWDAGIEEVGDDDRG